MVLNNDVSLPEENGARWLNNIFEGNHWGKLNGRSLLVTNTLEQQDPRLFDAMDAIGEHGLLKDIRDVDVKDLLETGRVVIEKRALFRLLTKDIRFDDDTLDQRGREDVVQYV